MEKDVSENMLEVKSNKKRKWKFLIGGFLLVIAIVIGLYIGYRKLNSNPVVIYKNLINDAYTLLSSDLKKVEKEEKDNKFQFDLDKAYRFDMDMTSSELEDFKINLGIGIDVKNEEGELDFDVIYSNESFVNGKVFLIDRNVYADVPKLTDKTISFGNVDFDSMIENLPEDFVENLDFDKAVNIDYQELDYIIKSMKNIIIDSFDKSKFNISKENVEVDGKEYKAKKIEYILDEENIKRTINFIVDEMLQDETLLSNIVKLTGKTMDQVKNKLDNYKNQDITGMETEKIVLYVDNFNNVLKVTLNVLDEEILEVINDKNGKYVLYAEEDGYSIKIEFDNDIFVSLGYNGKGTISMVTDNVYKLIGVIAGLYNYGANTSDIEEDVEFFGDFQIVLKKNNVSIYYKEDVNDEKPLLRLDFNNFVIKEDKITFDYNYDISVEGESVNLQGSGTFKETTLEIEKPKNTIKVDEITDKDLEKFYAAILEPFMGSLGDI